VRCPLASLAVTLLALCLGACGGASNERGSVVSNAGAVRQGGSHAKAVAGESLAAPVRGDGDGDSSEQTAFDSDDFHSLHFGHAAGAAEEHTIAAVVKRYYAALARQETSTVCSLLLEVVAESMPSEQAESESRLPAENATCAMTIAGVLAESHRALLSEERTLRVVGVRVRRRRASALLRFGNTAARHILLYKEEGKWKIGTLADEDLG
jgi:hypothetical protein